MKYSRIFYLILICTIILLGLLSRKISGVPLFIGDILWAIMIFFGIRFIIPESDVKVVAFISIIMCYLVEISQLYRADWINAIRSTLIGRLVLGQGFLWSDIIFYTVGVAVAYKLDRFLRR